MEIVTKPANADHNVVALEETLKLRTDGGLRFGQSTVLTVEMPQEGVTNLLGSFPAGCGYLTRVIQLPPEDEERQRLDATLRERLSTLCSQMKELESTRDGMILKGAVADRVTAFINTGYGKSEPYYLLLVDNLSYRVDKNGSVVADLTASKTQVDFVFNPSVEADFLNVAPSLSKLITLQDLTGETLRSAVPEMSQLFTERLTAFKDGIELLLGSPLKALPVLAVDIPRDETEGTVLVRFYPDKALQLDRFVIVG